MVSTISIVLRKAHPYVIIFAYLKQLMPMKRFLLFIFLPFLCAAQVPEYYRDINFDLTGNALKDQLTQLITTTHRRELVYTPDVWNALRQTDLDPDNSDNVLLIYGYNDTDDIVSNDRTRNKNRTCHTSSCNGLWVREHVYARSLGNPNLEFEGPGSDAHHLRSIDNTMNGSRSNRRFADGSGNSTTLPNSLFYPGDEWKGDIARMMMYMYVRYSAQCEATNVGSGSSSYSYWGDMPDIFLEWNQQDPVSQYERNRNNILETLQGNRNPFIDNPYIATMIWNGPQAADPWGTLSTQSSIIPDIFVYPTLTTGLINIQTTLNHNFKCRLYNSLGQQISVNQESTTLNISGNQPGIYFLTIYDGTASKNFRIILK